MRKMFQEGVDRVLKMQETVEAIDEKVTHSCDSIRLMCKANERQLILCSGEAIVAYTATADLLASYNKLAKSLLTSVQEPRKDAADILVAHTVAKHLKTPDDDLTEMRDAFAAHLQEISIASEEVTAINAEVVEMQDIVMNAISKPYS